MCAICDGKKEFKIECGGYTWDGRLKYRMMECPVCDISIDKYSYVSAMELIEKKAKQLLKHNGLKNIARDVNAALQIDGMRELNITYLRILKSYWR